MKSVLIIILCTFLFGAIFLCISYLSDCHWHIRKGHKAKDEDNCDNQEHQDTEFGINVDS